MIWDIHFEDGSKIQAQHERFECARILAQYRRIASGEDGPEQTSVTHGTLISRFMESVENENPEMSSGKEKDRAWMQKQENI